MRGLLARSMRAGSQSSRSRPVVMSMSARRTSSTSPGVGWMWWGFSLPAPDGPHLRPVAPDLPGDVGVGGEGGHDLSFCCWAWREEDVREDRRQEKGRNQEEDGRADARQEGPGPGRVSRVPGRDARSYRLLLWLHGRLNRSRVYGGPGTRRPGLRRSSPGSGSLRGTARTCAATRPGEHPLGLPDGDGGDDGPHGIPGSHQGLHPIHPCAQVGPHGGLEGAAQRIRPTGVLPLPSKACRAP
jgi:hypothetical protein